MKRNKLLGLPILLILLITSAFIVNASVDGFKVTAAARTVSTDSDSLKDDILVYGKVSVSTTDTVKINLEIEITDPEGGSESQKIKLTGTGTDQSVLKIDYQTTFNDFVTIKGMYEITVTAYCEDLTTTASFTFDPPGGTPGPPKG
ncbi:MAG: hypothetical protein PVJ38_05080 [Candidatus Bathyarchaeota archaeon]|jgi:hypothetical protein